MTSLEYLTDSHVSALARMASDRRISETSGVPTGCDETIVRVWVTANRIQPRKEITFVIMHNGDIAGCCILKKINWEAGHAELSSWLGVDFWAKGIAAEASELMRDFAFETYTFHYLHVHYLKATNGVAGRIGERLGFIPDVSRDDVPVRGRFQHLAPDVWTFMILHRERWQISRRSPSWAIFPKTSIR